MLRPSGVCVNRERHLLGRNNAGQGRSPAVGNPLARRPSSAFSEESTPSNVCSLATRKGGDTDSAHALGSPANGGPQSRTNGILVVRIPSHTKYRIVLPQGQAGDESFLELPTLCIWRGR